MKANNFFSLIVTVLSALMIFLFIGCGDGGGSGGGSSSSGPKTGVISGSAVKGPVNSATVMAFGVKPDGTMGTQIGTATTNAQGNFSMNVVEYSGPVMLQVMGGNYVDEATGQLMNMYQNTVMTAVIPHMNAGEPFEDIQITPVTSMAQAWAESMTGGMTQANITMANGDMGQFFDINNILTTYPMDPLVDGSGAIANQDQQHYGMVLAAMSQEALDLMMPYSSGMVTAMMDDASDGIMDGYIGDTQISMGGMGGMMGGGMMGGTMMDSFAGTSGLADAMITFIGNTTVNRSGLTITDMQPLINHLDNSNGTIQ